MNAMITKVDLEGQTVDAVVAEWMQANEARWKEWIK
jgi:glycine betaine/proline transport system substrate-binding protein